MAELILGGARSGKSALAELRAADSGLAVTYIATADAATSAGDGEMARRIAHHKARRPPQWSLVEEPLHLAAVLSAHAAPNRLLLVDCLTLWLSNLLFRETPIQSVRGEPVEPQAIALFDNSVSYASPSTSSGRTGELNQLLSGQAGTQAEAEQAVDCPLLREETQALIDCLPTLPGRVILVSNEVGLGIIPMGAITRLYVDEAGRLNQRIAQVCDQVTFVAAGLPMELKTR